MFKNVSHHVSLACAVLLGLVVSSCFEKNTTFNEEEQNNKVALNLETGYQHNQLSGEPINYLISPTGDTIQTGIELTIVPKKVNKDSIRAPKVVLAGNGKSIKRDFKLYYYPKNIDTSEIIHDSIKVIPFSPHEQDHFVVTSFGDTVKTGIPIKLVPETVEAKAPDVIKALPPYYMDNCYSDIQSLDVAQGLKSGYINTFHQDDNSNLWFGTTGEGLCKYDGVNFYFYTIDHGLPANEVRDMIDDSEGNLWLSTDEGLCKFDGNYFYNYTEKQGYIDNTCRYITRDSAGNIWAGNRVAGLAKFDGSKFTFFTTNEGMISNNITNLKVGANGDIWFANGSLCQFNGNEFKYYQSACGLSSDTTTDLFCTKDGRVWVTVGEGLIECVCRNKIIKYGKLDGLDIDSEHKVLYEDSKKNLWIGTPIGICMFDGEKIQRFTNLEGQSWKEIITVKEDDVGNIWIGTYGTGMHRYKENSFSMLTEYHGLSEDVQFIAYEDNDGNMWFGAKESGLSIFDGNQFLYYNENSGLPGNAIRAICEDNKGNMWLGTNERGMAKYDGKTFTHYTTESGLTHNTVKCIYQDSKDNIWLATFNGLTRIDSNNNIYHYTREQGFTAPVIWNIVEDIQGNIWMATGGSGLIKYDGVKFIFYTEREGLSSNRLRSITPDDFGNIWIGTFNMGVVKFNGDTFEYFNEDFGISNNKIMTTTIDETGNIWVGTDHGLSVIENNRSNIDTHVVRNFSYVDGLKALDFNTTSSFRDSKNNIWLPTGKGVVSINADYVNFQYQKPSVQLSYINVSDEYIDFRDDKSRVKYKISYDSVAAFNNYPINPTFHYSINQISFNFSAVDWSAPHRIKYSYKLEGLNDEWSNETSENRVDFRNLSSGDYVFKVRARADHGEWCEPFEYPFTISTPWWRTNIAYGLYVAGFIMFFVLIIQQRTRRLKIRQYLLEDKIALATEQLQEQNNQLGQQNVKIERQKAEVEQQKAIIESNHQQIKDSIHYSKKIQHSLLLPPEELRANYSNFFLLFEPKDIVSGDFYFFRQFGDIDYISCVDCTGHGVPGGFMSTLGYLLMDKIIQDDSKHPGEILKELSEALITTLHQQDDNSIQDGMDMSLCRVDRKNRTIEFAGARNGVLIVDSEKVTHHAPDYLPVGGNYMKKGKPITRKFETKKISIPEGAWVVLYTDGYVEQLGGIEGLPMRSSQYESIILEATKLGDKDKIKAYLSNKLLEWQGDQIRIDDVCIIGFKI